MCYYTAYVYTVCGHVTISEFPVHNSPCPKRLLVHGTSSQRPKSLPPDTGRFAESSIERPLSVIPAVEPRPSEVKLQSDCDEKLIHAMHTLSIERLCASCITEREARLASFQMRMRDDMGQRISTRLTNMNNGAGWRGRQFRATSASPPRPMATKALEGLSKAGDEPPLTALAPRRPSIAGSDTTDVSVASSGGVSVQEAVGNFMRGVKGGWNVPDGRSLFSPAFSSTGRQSILASPVSPRSRTPAGTIAAAAVSAAGQPIGSQNLSSPNLLDRRVLLSFGGLGD